MFRLPLAARLFLRFAAAIFLITAVASDTGHATAPQSVSYFEVTGPIDPAAERFIADRILDAERSGDAALVIRLDTPGGLEVDPGELSKTVADSKVPVVVWIPPGRGRAPSLGTYLALSADVLAIAPGASIGPALPADLSMPAQGRGKDRALLHMLLARHEKFIGSGADLASQPMSASGASAAKLADLTARTVPELLERISGFTSSDGALTLRSGPFVPRFHKMPLFSRLLHAAVSPSSAYLLLFLGLFGLIFEIYNPGVGGGALTGGIMLMFGLYGLSILPTNWLGVGLIFLAFLLLLYDLQLSQLGPLSAAGGVAMATGSVIMFRSAPALPLPWWMIATCMAGAAAFFFGAMPAAIRARTAKPVSGSENIVGTTGVARTDISPEGQVMAGGTLWRARTLEAAIAQGAPVKVKGVAGLVLMVEQVHTDPAQE